MLTALGVAATPTSALVVPPDKEASFFLQLICRQIGPCGLSLSALDKDGKTVLKADVSPPYGDLSNPVVDIRKLDGTTLVRGILRKGVTTGVRSGSSEVDLSLPDGSWIGRLCEDSKSMGTAYDLYTGTFVSTLYMHFECVFEGGEPSVAVSDTSGQPLAQTTEGSLGRRLGHLGDKGYLKTTPFHVRPNADAAVILACVVAMNLRWAEFFNAD